MQDRIIGPLTMVQFVYAVIGFGLCYVIYRSIPQPASYFLVVPIAGFVVCLDFVKINERPFLEFFLAAIAFMGNPKRRIWHQGEDSDMKVEIYEARKTGPNIQHKIITHEQIAELARRTDSTDQEKMIEQ